MGRYTFMVTLSLASILAVPNAYAAPQKVIGVYQENLSKYEEDGRKIGEIKVNAGELEGTEVLATTPRKLVKVKYQGKEVWFRASQLKFSLPEMAKCPKAAPGKSIDRDTPAASGMGAECAQ